MWMLSQTASETHSRPSDLVCIEDKLVAYLFDSAVVTFRRIVENALAEQVNLGSPTKPDWKPKYTLDQLLASDFHLPNEGRKKKLDSPSNSMAPGVAQILAYSAEGTKGIKRWEYRPN